MAITLGYFTITSSAFFTWPCINMIFFAVVYFANKPSWFFKNQNGKIHSIIYFLNLPWLLFSTVTWHIQRILSSENPSNHIEGTNVTVGRKLLKNESPDNIEAIIDLTSEFNETNSGSASYFNIPLLDGISPPKNIFAELKFIVSKIQGKQVFVHCAQGHGLLQR